MKETVSYFLTAINPFFLHDRTVGLAGLLVVLLRDYIPSFLEGRCSQQSSVWANRMLSEVSHGTASRLCKQKGLHPPLLPSVVAPGDQALAAIFVSEAETHNLRLVTPTRSLGP